MGRTYQPHQPPLFASELLQRLNDNQLHSNTPRWTDSITRQILNVCSYLDDGGAWQWPYWKVAATFALALIGVRVVGKKRMGVDWYALVHALVSFVGCAAVVYLDAIASEPLTGISEPMRSLQCHAPLTSLHRILPAITMGYSLLDLFDGLFISVDFALHGAVTMLVLAYYCAIEAPHIVEPLLIVEASTVFLVLVRAEFMSDAAAALNQALFVLTFFLARCVASPYLHYRILKVLWTDDDWRNCYPGHFLPVSIISGLFFHCLNYFWLYKIVRKVLRKMQGQEGIRANNDISDAANHKLNNGVANGASEKKEKAS